MPVLNWVAWTDTFAPDLFLRCSWTSHRTGRRTALSMQLSSFLHLRSLRIWCLSPFSAVRRAPNDGDAHFTSTHALVADPPTDPRFREGLPEPEEINYFTPPATRGNIGKTMSPAPAFRVKVRAFAAADLAPRLASDVLFLRISRALVFPTSKSRPSCSM